MTKLKINHKFNFKMYIDSYLLYFNLNFKFEMVDFVFHRDFTHPDV